MLGVIRSGEVMSKQQINEEYEQFLNHMSDLALRQRVIHSSFKREFEILAKFKNDSASEIVSCDALGFMNLFTGKFERYTSRKTSYSELENETIRQKNNQYCWLVVDAYERFESLIFKIHELLIGESLPKKNRELKKTLCYFSYTYSSVSKAEKTNFSGVNLKIALLMVEKFRHKVVHSQGVIDDEKVFIDKILHDSGINNDKDLHVRFIKQFICDGRVNILERSIQSDSIVSMYHDVYTNIASYLVGYSKLVVDTVNV